MLPPAKPLRAVVPLIMCSPEEIEMRTHAAALQDSVYLFVFVWLQAICKKTHKYL
jgi:hypothetical protein